MTDVKHGAGQAAEGGLRLTQVMVSTPLRREAGSTHPGTFAMEYVIHMDTAGLDLAVIGDALQRFDPAAIADIDSRQQVLRVAAMMLDQELLAALDQAGHPVRAEQVERLPSVCCGGCSG